MPPADRDGDFADAYARLELLEAAGHGTGPGMADGVRAALDEFALDELARPR
ncbi:hypothetical protein ACN26Y_22485 [Micromonospora sp. WMMD558]|uniref:hypothetical protein n=1 Tax=Micromonospora sp. WMMD558 TaxID=3403462 RepID=UPI003BF564E4